MKNEDYERSVEKIAHTNLSYKKLQAYARPKKMTAGYYADI